MSLTYAWHRGRSFLSLNLCAEWHSLNPPNCLMGWIVPLQYLNLWSTFVGVTSYKPRRNCKWKLTVRNYHDPSSFQTDSNCPTCRSPEGESRDQLHHHIHHHGNPSGQQATTLRPGHGLGASVFFGLTSTKLRRSCTEALGKAALPNARSKKLESFRRNWPCTLITLL